MNDTAIAFISILHKYLHCVLQLQMCYDDYYHDFWKCVNKEAMQQ